MRANMTEDVTSQGENVAAAESICDVNKVDDVTREMENHPCAQTTTVVTSTLSPAPTVETVCDVSTGRPSRLKKFIDRRTETLISACATISTSVVDEADVSRDTSDVVDRSKSNEHVTSPVLRSTKYRDRQFDVSSPHDRRQLGVVKDATPHRSMLASVPATTTTTTTTTCVNMLRSPASLITVRSERPQRETTAAVACSSTTAVVCPSCSAASRLTVTLAESTCQQSQRNCRLITRTAAAASTKPRDVAESGTDNADDDVSARPAAVQSPVSSRRPRLHSFSSSGLSVADGDAETSKSVRPSSTVCVLAQLSPGPGRTASSDRQVPTTSSESSAAAGATSTSMVISRRTVFELIKSPPPQSVIGSAVTELSLPVKASCSAASTTSRHPAIVPSPSKHELTPSAKTPVTEGASVMTALDDALAMLSHVVSENCQPENCQSHPASPAAVDVHGVITAQAVQGTCKSPCIG